MTSLRWRTTWWHALTPTQATDVQALVDQARSADGVTPLSDDVALTIHPAAAPAGGPDAIADERPGRPGRLPVHLLATANADPGDSGSDAGPTDRDDDERAADGRGRRHGTVIGYAHLGPVSETGRQAELVVRPDRRRLGVGAALLGALTAATAATATTAASVPATAASVPPARDLAPPPDGPGAADGTAQLAVWAHGDSAAAAALAAAAGFTRTRVLLQLRRGLGPDPAGLPAPEWPDGVSVRAFEPGRDEQAWLALNARAFASHPDQGRWTADDLLPREREPWFDPAGFFLAERAGRLVGFHWTKVHAQDPTPPRPPAGARDAADADADGPAVAGPIGEVYVVGVEPEQAGTGLGRALTLAGLRHLRDRGLDTVALYADEDNVRAVRLYERLGFSRYAVDAQYRWRGPAAD